MFRRRNGTDADGEVDERKVAIRREEAFDCCRKLVKKTKDLEEKELDDDSSTGSYDSNRLFFFFFYLAGSDNAPGRGGEEERRMILGGRGIATTNGMMARAHTSCPANVLFIRVAGLWTDTSEKINRSASFFGTPWWIVTPIPSLFFGPFLF